MVTSATRHLSRLRLLRRMARRKRNERLPLLSYVAERSSLVEPENVFVIAVQHLLPTTYTLFEEMFKLGLPPSQLAVLGKCYSTAPEVVTRLKQLGVQVGEASQAFEPNESYDTSFTRYIQEFINLVLETNELKSFDKIIVLDDGGYLIQAMGKTIIPKHKLVGIEQTSSGYNILQAVGVTFPVINLAKCWLKVTYETPLILKVARASMARLVSGWNHDRPKALIIGGGVIGRECAQEIDHSCSVQIYDSNPRKSQLSADQFRSALPETDIVIGATGCTSLPASKHATLRRPVMLASMSSSDREFDAVAFRQKVGSNLSCHDDLEVDGIRLLNGGFPITFSRDHDVSDPDELDLTRAMILGSIVQANRLSREVSPQFVGLSHQLQLELHDQLELTHLPAPCRQEAEFVFSGQRRFRFGQI